jgi:hypothetical protein
MQMIVNDLERVAREMLIYVVRSLIVGEVSAAAFVKRFFVQRKKCRVALHTQTACFTLAEMIAHQQQLRGGQSTKRVLLNLFLRQVFH